MKIKILNAFLIFLSIIAVAISCGKNEPEEPELPDENKEQLEENIALLNETVVNIEKALSSGDQAAFLNFIDSGYQKFYKDALQSNQAKLASFAEVFKTRKLQKCDGFHAVYYVQYNGKSFEITMILGDDGKWKLKDL